MGVYTKRLETQISLLCALAAFGVSAAIPRPVGHKNAAGKAHSRIVAIPLDSPDGVSGCRPPLMVPGVVGRAVRFDGYTALYDNSFEDEESRSSLPELTAGALLRLKEFRERFPCFRALLQKSDFLVSYLQ